MLFRDVAVGQEYAWTHLVGAEWVTERVRVARKALCWVYLEARSGGAVSPLLPHVAARKRRPRAEHEAPEQARLVAILRAAVAGVGREAAWMDRMIARDRAEREARRDAPEEVA